MGEDRFLGAVGDSCLDAALLYASMGMRVLPINLGAKRGSRVICTCGREGCRLAGKHPITENGVHDATCDLDTIRDWWRKWPEANVAIACGPESGVVVVDVDPRHGGKLTDEMSDRLGTTLTAKSGGGGLHLYYTWPEGESKLPGMLGEGIDLKGAGGYILAAPSYHLSGKQYSWSRDVWPAEPDGLVRLLAETGAKKVGGNNGTPSELKKITPERALELLELGADAVQMATEGTRNNVLNREAYSLGGLVSRGALDRDLVRERLFRAAQQAEQGDDPFTDDEISTTLDRALGEGEDSPRDVVVVDPDDHNALEDEHPGWDWTETGLGRRLLGVIEKHDILCVGEYGALWKYSPEKGVWIEVSERWCADLMLGNWHGFKESKKYLNITRNKYQNVRWLAHEMRLMGDFFEEQPSGVALRDVTWLQGRGLVSHCSDHRLTVSIDVDWDARADCPRWQAVLDRVLPGQEKQRLWQEFVGATLCCQTSTYRGYLVMTGPGKNGKSLLLEVATGLLPNGVVTSVPPHDMTDRNYRADLARKRLNVVTEMPKDELKNTEALKAIVTGDRISARANYGNVFNFTPRIACLFAANELPMVQDQSYGFWDRCYVLPMEERLEDGEIESGESRRILESEKAGVVRWALEGADRLVEQGKFTRATDTDNAKELWRLESDQVALWLHENCAVGGDWTRSKECYGNYRAWAALAGHGRMSTTLFGRRLRNNNVAARKVKGQKEYRLRILTS